MDHIKSIYFKRHLYKFEHVWEDEKYRKRNINDLNGFLCCLCCVVPFGIIKASIMILINLIILIPITLIISIILFPYQLIIIYITTLWTVLLGRKIKFILFLTNWLLYTIFILFYLIIIYLSCIYFSFYASFKVTLSDNYCLFGGYIDSIKIIFINIWIYIENNTVEFNKYCKNIKNYILNQEEGDFIWDISFISWCNVLMAIIMTIFAVILIMTFVGLIIIIYFIPFSIHLMINLYIFKFIKYYFGTCIMKQPCLALIGCPFIIFPILLIPIFAAIYLIFYVWLYSAFFNKAIIIQYDITNPFNLLQQFSFIGNTILLYNNSFIKYCFQSCWKCHCCHKHEKPDDDGWDLQNIQNIKKQIKNKKKKNKDEDDDYNPYEIKFRHLSAIFWDTKNNKDLVTCGKKKTSQQIKEKQREEHKKEQYKQQQLNIEHFTSPNIGKKTVKQQEYKKNKTNIKKQKKRKAQTRKKRVESDSSSISFNKSNGKLIVNSSKKYKYNHMGHEYIRTVDEEHVTDDEELNVLMPDSVRYQHQHSNNDDNRFKYPRGI